jgi:hypothetical protein
MHDLSPFAHVLVAMIYHVHREINHFNSKPTLSYIERT